MQERKSEKERRRKAQLKASQKRQSRHSKENQTKNGPHHKLARRNSQTRTSAKRLSSRKKKTRNMDKGKDHHGSKESLGSSHSLPSLTGAVDVIRTLPPGSREPTSPQLYDTLDSNNPDVIPSRQRGQTNEALDVDDLNLCMKKEEVGHF